MGRRNNGRTEQRCSPILDDLSLAKAVPVNGPDTRCSCDYGCVQTSAVSLLTTVWVAMMSGAVCVFANLLHGHSKKQITVIYEGRRGSKSVLFMK